MIRSLYTGQAVYERCVCQIPEKKADLLRGSSICGCVRTCSDSEQVVCRRLQVECTVDH
uniref:Uncharacterized protein n=1 Tax=Anguilla anguilla TaxID=7936 RepID=A0A0E9VFZ3_ANGAN